MKLLRRLLGGKPALIFCIALSAVVFTGCETAYDEAGPVSWRPPPSAPVTTAPVTPATVTAPPMTTPSVTTVPSLQPETESVYQVGDTVVVTFTGVSDQTLPYEEQIKGDGTMTMPLIGHIKAAGKTRGQLQAEVYSLYTNRYYKASSGFTVTVKPQVQVFYIGGEVRATGPKGYIVGTTLTKAIQTAGDFTDFANKRNIQIIRADGTKTRVSWNRAIRSADYDVLIFPGDTIHVKRRIFW